MAKKQVLKTIDDTFKAKNKGSVKKEVHLKKHLNQIRLRLVSNH